MRLSHGYRVGWRRPRTDPRRPRGERRARCARPGFGPSRARRVGLRRGSVPRPDRGGIPAQQRRYRVAKINNSWISRSTQGLWKNPFRRAKSGERNPESESRRAKAGERKPESESRRAKAGERNPESESRRAKAGERKPESESRRAKAGERKPESESRRAKSGERKPESESRRAKAELRTPYSVLRTPNSVLRTPNGREPSSPKDLPHRESGISEVPSHLFTDSHPSGSAAVGLMPKSRLADVGEARVRRPTRSDPRPAISHHRGQVARVQCVALTNVLSPPRWIRTILTLDRSVPRGKFTPPSSSFDWLVHVMPLICGLSPLLSYCGVK